MILLFFIPQLTTHTTVTKHIFCGSSQYKDIVLLVDASMIKIRRHHDHLIFIMGIPIPETSSIWIETGPRNLIRHFLWAQWVFLRPCESWDPQNHTLDICPIWCTERDGLVDWKSAYSTKSRLMDKYGRFLDQPLLGMEIFWWFSARKT